MHYNYSQGMSKKDFILDMMDIIGRPSKNYVRAKNQEVVDFYVEWPYLESLGKKTLADLLDYFYLDHSMLDNMRELVDFLSDYEVPEGAFYESDGDLVDYPEDYKYKTRQTGY